MSAKHAALKRGGCGEVINGDAWCDPDAVPSTAGLCDSPAKHREHLIAADDRARVTAVGPDDAGVEAAARAIAAAIGWRWGEVTAEHDARRLARAALAAVQTADRQRVQAVEQLADDLDAEAKRHDDAEPISAEGLHRMILAARCCRDQAARIRAALGGGR